MCNGKKRDESGGDFPHARVRFERRIQDEVTRFVQAEPNCSTRKKLRDIGGLGANGRRSTAEHGEKAENRARGTQVAPFGREAQQLL